MNKRVLCFFGIHSYQIVNRGRVADHNGSIVGYWTIRECPICAKSKYKQYY